MTMQNDMLSSWPRDVIVRALAAQGGTVVSALPPSSFNAIQRDLPSGSASIDRPPLTLHAYRPAWWWLVSHETNTEPGHRVPNADVQTIWAPTFVCSENVDLVQAHAPLTRLVQDKQFSTNIVRLRQLDTLVGSISHVDTLILGTGILAIDVLKGAYKLIRRHAPTIIIDTSASSVAGEYSTLNTELQDLLNEVGYSNFRPSSSAPEGSFAIFDQSETFHKKQLLRDIYSMRLTHQAAHRPSGKALDEFMSVGWGQRQFHEVELASGANFLEFYLSGSHRGDVRVFAIREGKMWFEDVYTIQLVDNQPTIYCKLPSIIHRTVAVRVRLTPIRHGTAASLDRMIVKYIISY
jgi:hypothetical protein